MEFSEILWGQASIRYTFTKAIQATRRYSIDRQRKRSIYVKKRTKQGDPLSSLLFNTVLQYSLESNLTKCLTNLRFADDVLLFSTSLKKLRDMLCDFKTSTEEVGLGIHPDKTKILSNQDNVKEKEITVDNIKIEILRKVTVQDILDKKVTFEDQETEEVKNRLKAAWAAFHKYRQELTSKGYRLCHILRLFNMVITPTMTYASGTWTLTQKHEKMIRTAQRKMFRLSLTEGQAKEFISKLRQGIGSDLDSLIARVGAARVKNTKIRCYLRNPSVSNCKQIREAMCAYIEKENIKLGRATPYVVEEKPVWRQEQQRIFGKALGVVEHYAQEAGKQISSEWYPFYQIYAHESKDSHPIPLLSTASGAPVVNPQGAEMLGVSVDKLAMACRRGTA